MAKTLGDVVNAGLISLKEPKITAFSAANMLQCHLIYAANNAVREVLALRDFEWGLKHEVLVTADDRTTGTMSVTNGSAGITHTSDLTGYEGYWLRIDGDRTSYEITAINGANPTQATLAASYTGTTNATATYRIFKDTYSLTITDLDEIEIAGYGDGQTWAQGAYPNSRVYLVDLAALFSMSGGDLHLDTSGKPKFMARISVDEDDQPRYVLWPFPTDDYVIDIWYKLLYSQATTFATTLFGGDAPQIAYDAVEHAVCAAAYKWDNLPNKAQDEERMYAQSLRDLLRRENSHDKEQVMGLEVNRRDYRHTFPSRSGTYFDTKSSLWGAR